MKRVVACLAVAVAVAGCGGGAPPSVSDAECEVVSLDRSKATWEVALVNSMDTRARFKISVDLYYAGEWYGSDYNLTRDTPPGQIATTSYTTSIELDDPGFVELYSCEVYEIAER